MDPTLPHFKPFEQLPLLTNQQINQMIKQGDKLLFMHQLVIDINGFNHPGNIQLLEAHINNPELDISANFRTFKHSYYAQMLICSKTIGRRQTIKSSELQSEYLGKQLYEKIMSLEKIKIHEAALRKIDFTQPIFSQLNALTPIEKSVIVQIPKIFNNPSKILFMETPFKEYMYQNDFWTSSITFQIVIVMLSIYLFSHYQLENILFGIPFFIFGLVKWTFLEYMFHRFDLHYDLLKNPKIGVHLMHHAFPNIQGKIALTISKILMYDVAFYFGYTVFLNEMNALLIITGVMVGLTLYDMIHYYCHFGPETNIKFINDLKRNHLKHHFRDSTKGFGVTNLFWDKLFGTEHVKN